MNKKRFQNIVAESRFSLTITAVACGLVWAAACFLNQALLPSLAMMVVTTYLMVEINNSNSLIRIYSRMVSCAFLALSTMTIGNFTSWQTTLVMLCLAVFYRITFSCYQDKAAVGRIFHAFLAIGLASCVFAKMLFLLPVLWIIVAVNLQAMTLRNFCASLLGLATPYWFLIAFAVMTDNVDGFVAHFTSLADFGKPFDITVLSLNSIINIAFVAVLNIIGTLHFVLNKLNDKIKTRTLYNIFIIMSLATVVFIAVQPQHADLLTSLLIVNTSPLIAHFMALTRGRWTNLTTIVIMIATLSLTFFNLWTAL